MAGLTLNRLHKAVLVEREKNIRKNVLIMTCTVVGLSSEPGLVKKRTVKNDKYFTLSLPHLCFIYDYFILTG